MESAGIRLSPESTGSRNVWALLDDRPGNTAQTRAVVEALGWPATEKPLRFRSAASLHSRILDGSRFGLQRASAATLEPPWPDLVIAAGRRNAPVARFVARASGGRTRLVMLGRKAGDYADAFDLVATPGYARLAPHPRRFVTRAPFHRVTRAALAGAAERWRERFADIPRPIVGVLIGGTTGQFSLQPDTAQRLGEAVVGIAAQRGGSVFATTSRRTPLAAADAFASALRGVDRIDRWSPNRGADDTPYLGVLALADELVVTGDSESMLAEATASGRPVYIVPLPERASFCLLRWPRETIYARATGASRSRLGAKLCARLIELGWSRPARDLNAMHEQLIRERRAGRFHVPYTPAAESPADELDAFVAQIRALFAARLPGVD